MTAEVVGGEQEKGEHALDAAGGVAKRREQPEEIGVERGAHGRRDGRADQGVTHADLSRRDRRGVRAERHSSDVLARRRPADVAHDAPDLLEELGVAGRAVAAALALAGERVHDVRERGGRAGIGLRELAQEPVGRAPERHAEPHDVGAPSDGASLARHDGRGPIRPPPSPSTSV